MHKPDSILFSSRQHQLSVGRAASQRKFPGHTAIRRQPTPVLRNSIRSTGIHSVAATAMTAARSTPERPEAFLPGPVRTPRHQCSRGASPGPMLRMRGLRVAPWHRPDAASRDYRASAACGQPKTCDPVPASRRHCRRRGRSGTAVTLHHPAPLVLSNACAFTATSPISAWLRAA